MASHVAIRASSSVCVAIVTVLECVMYSNLFFLMYLYIAFLPLINSMFLSSSPKRMLTPLTLPALIKIIFVSSICFNLLFVTVSNAQYISLVTYPSMLVIPPVCDHTTRSPKVCCAGNVSIGKLFRIPPSTNNCFPQVDGGTRNGIDMDMYTA